MSTFEITRDIIAPIFMVIGCAVVTDRLFDIDPRGLSRLVIYLFTPFLVFHRLAHTELTAGEAVELLAIAWGTQVIVALLAWRLARWLKFERKLESAFVLTATLINAGNYGLPLNRFAFGAQGEERALIFFVATIITTNTLGVFLASRGSVSTGRALRNVLVVPLPYAAVLGLVVHASGINLTGSVDRASALLAQAAVPTMITVLGIRLSRIPLKKAVANLQPALMSAGLRLAISPLVALGIVTVIGAGGLTRQVALVQAAMPTAVISSVLASEFGSDEDFVTASILVSTLASIVTLSILLSLVM
jgi:predicted permease